MSTTDSVHGWSHWTTPQSVLDLIPMPIGLDPCSNEHSIVGARCRAFTGDGPGGLALDWDAYLIAGECVYVNPPYGRALPKWAAKMIADGERGVPIFALVPPRTDSKWCQAVLRSCDVALFLAGRVKFGNPPPGCNGNAPSLPSMLVCWAGERGLAERVAAHWEESGRGIVMLKKGG